MRNILTADVPLIFRENLIPTSQRTVSVIKNLQVRVFVVRIIQNTRIQSIGQMQNFFLLQQ